MADQTPRLKLPFMSTAQVQKELTFNELAAMVDTLLHLNIIDKDLNAAPGAPAEGDTYIIGPTPTGIWAGKADYLAYYVGGWHYLEPSNGWLGWVIDESAFYRYSGGDWAPTLIVPVENLVELLDVTAGTPGPSEQGYAVAWDDVTGKFTLQPVAQTIAALLDVDLTGLDDGYMLQWDESESKFVAVPASNVTNFTDLADAPSAYTGMEGYHVVVNLDADGLEFVPPPESSGDGATTFTDLTDTPDNYIGQANRVVAVNETEDGLIYTELDELVAGVPPGGNTNQVLVKSTDTDFNTEWVDPSEIGIGIPNGGLEGQVLAKVSDDDGDADWVEPPVALPLGGTTGQVLAKASDDDLDAHWVPAVTAEGGWFTPVTATGTGASQDIVLPVSGLTDDQIIVFVNGIRYETDEYSISGATVTLTTNAAGDSVEIVSAGTGGGVVALSVVNPEAADYTLSPDDVGTYTRLTAAGTKNVNIATEATTALNPNGEWHIRNVGAGNATIVPAGGVTVHVPYGGTLVLAQGMTATLKRVAADEFDLIGQTVPA